MIGGLPGTGKSTVARAVGAQLAVTVVAKDVVEASLRRSGIDADRSWRVANELLATIADDHLDQGRSVVLDAVFGDPDVRAQVREIAEGRGARWRLVECTCSDLALHRSRIEGRVRGIAGWDELTWEDVEGTRSRYRTWTEERLVLDALDPLDANVDRAVRYLTA